MVMNRIHTGLNVRGFITERDSVLKKLFKDQQGRSLSARDAREYLMDQLSKGVETLPFGDPCEGWDPKNGCPGHQVPDEDRDA